MKTRASRRLGASAAALLVLAALSLAGAARAQDGESHQLGWDEPAQLDARISDLQLHGPRPFGLLIGERIVHRISFTTAAGVRLQRATVPVRRRIGDWLELQQVEMQIDGNRHHLVLTYQLFATPLTVGIRTIPGFTLRFVDRGESFPVTIPSWTFVQSPLLAADVAHEGENIVAMRPLTPPRLLATAGYRYGLAASGFAALAGGAALLWLFAVPARRRRPFAETRGELKRLHAKPRDQARLRAGFRALHRGLDESYDAAVFAADVPAFCRRVPGFADQEAAVASFFADSQAEFFGQAPADPAPERWARLEALARRWAAAERRR